MVSGPCPVVSRPCMVVSVGYVVVSYASLVMSGACLIGSCVIWHMSRTGHTRTYQDKPEKTNLADLILELAF